MVKIGVRKQSWKKSVAARTKGQFTRSVKRAIIPGYGKRGAGWAHPRRKLYNKAYSRSTVSVRDLVSGRKKKEGNLQAWVIVVLVFILGVLGQSPSLF
jgi:hypothetical protein